MGKEEQIIMVVKRKNLFGVESLDESPQGFLSAETYDFSSELNKWGEWKRRGTVDEPPQKSMESNHSYKQPIAYSVLFDPNERKIFAYQRLSKGHETRLQNKWSWGIGGHVEREDVIKIFDDITMEIIERSRIRELREEVGVEGDKATHFLGYINSDFRENGGVDSVGSVHFGLVYLVNASPSEVTIRDELKQGAWKSIQELQSMCEDSSYDVERWSKIIVEPLEKYLKTGIV